MSKQPPRPTGQRFSQVYIERGEPVGESERMRERMLAIVIDLPKGVRDALSAEVHRRLGVAWQSWGSFFRSGKMRDVLDFVTIALPHLRAAERYMPSGTANQWLKEVRQIFTEENLHYSFDDAGGGHFSYDGEFDFRVAAAIAALELPRYENARQEFDDGRAALAQAPPDGRGGIRATFNAAEAIFKLIFPRAPELNAKAADQLGPVLQKIYSDDTAALGASAKMLASLKEWVNAAHFYRHATGPNAAPQPPLHLAVQLVSVGAANLRWLTELDQLR